MRYRNAAMAEFWRALRALKVLQAEQAEEHAAGAEVLEMPPRQPVCRRASRPVRRRTNPRADRCTKYLIPDQPGPGRTLHEPAAPWNPNEPERPSEAAPERRLEYVLPPTLAPGQTLHEPAAPWNPNEPDAIKHPKLVARPPAPAPGRPARHGLRRSHGPHEQMPNEWLRSP
jgi:hypothetical protein